MRAYLLGAGPRQLHRLVRRDHQRHRAPVERHIVQHAHHWHEPGHSHQITIWLSRKLCDKSDKPEPPHTELRLLVVGHLHEGGVALIIQDLDALDVAIDTKQREQRVRRDFLTTAAPELDQTQLATVSRPFGPSVLPSVQAPPRSACSPERRGFRRPCWGPSGRRMARAWWGTAPASAAHPSEAAAGPVRLHPCIKQGRLNDADLFKPHRRCPLEPPTPQQLVPICGGPMVMPPSPAGPAGKYCVKSLRCGHPPTNAPFAHDVSDGRLRLHDDSKGNRSTVAGHC